ncbi:GntR family transcriptional regulator [Rhodococcus sp. IEGM 1381]|uniref:GntR family transcriptional regulator n=1 Tax=Rhodococcus sp. IEGM 1381 TaxID=3047085 RepID=UPI0024B733DB|nr:GntR family transcriptional regulator [Rhodococcus sp. IEGM 1381]MDI9897411.1 GntR family transcriptional regulator [Rhodococcus sp. IEGM 1381]
MNAPSNFSMIEVGSSLSGRRITADHIVESLRRAINDGVLADGTQLNQVDLASHFGVSRVPVREALRQLQAEGLIQSHAHKLSYVRGTDPHRLADVFMLRGLIEGWLIERAIPSIDPSVILRAREINELLRNEAHHPSWLELNREFHSLLFAAAKSEEGMGVLQPLQMRSQRYSRLWSKGNGVHRPAETCDEHDHILDLIEAGDAAGAREASVQHVMHTCDAVLAAGRLMQADAGVHA